MIEVQEIIEFLGIDGLTNTSGKVKGMKQLNDPYFSTTDLAWCSDKNLELLTDLKGGYVIVSTAMLSKAKELNQHVTYLPVEQPRAAFSAVLQRFFVPPQQFGIIHNTAIIDLSVTIDLSKVNIGAHVVIEANCTIGEYSEIGHNTVIKHSTVIGKQCKIGCNNTIGGVGFGYEMNELQQYELIPHIGNVHLGDAVEIGNNVCIDRAVLGSTYLANHVKVDNLVHIAHGVRIGENSLIIANSMIAGSVEIGANTWVSPSVSIRQKLSIGDQALVGMGAVVVKSVENGSIVAGNPAKPFEKK